MKRPVQGGPPLRQAVQPDGALLTVAEVGTLFEADLAVALAQSHGYQVKRQSVVGWGILAMGEPVQGPYVLRAHEADAADVRALFDEHNIDVRIPQGLPWKGALVATMVILGFIAVLIVASSLRAEPTCPAWAVRC